MRIISQTYDAYNVSMVPIVGTYPPTFNWLHNVMLLLNHYLRDLFSHICKRKFILISPQFNLVQN